MNQWILDRYLNTQPVHLERMSSGRAVSIVLAHGERSVEPLWIMKTSADPEDQRRLQIEGEALEYLKPWAEELGIPEILEWRTSDSEVCLLRSVVSGRTYPARPLLSDSLDRLESVFRPALKWIKLFRERVKPPAERCIGDVVSPLCEALRQEGQSALRALGAYLERSQDVVGDQPAVVIHGDYFPRNIIQAANGRLRVVDWDHFGVGVPYRDELNLIVGTDFVHRSGRTWDVDEIWRAFMFSNLPIAAFVGRELEGSSVAVRFYHYCYLAWQAIHGAPVERHRWLRTIQMLEPHGFPGPDSGLSNLAPAIN